MQMNNYNLNYIMARLESIGITNGFNQTPRIAGLMGVMFFGWKGAKQALLPDHKPGD